MDVEKLLKALDNEENSKFLNLTTKKINDMKSEILKELQLSQQEITEIMRKLKEYMYVDEMNELRHGAFIRWIPIKDPDNLHLTAGGLLCAINVTDDGVSLTCKNFSHKHYQIKMDECLIFQKLTNQEQVLLSAMDHLAK
jgi:cell division protein ZapA (FtsZ GTPase activity inhibitor)